MDVNCILRNKIRYLQIDLRDILYHRLLTETDMLFLISKDSINHLWNYSNIIHDIGYYGNNVVK